MTTPAGYTPSGISTVATSPVPATLSPVEAGSTEPTPEQIQETFGEFAQHVEFVNMVQDAQDRAIKTQERVPYSWKGYKSSVFPNLPKFQLKDLQERLRLALKGVFNITLKERQVSY